MPGAPFINRWFDGSRSRLDRSGIPILGRSLLFGMGTPLPPLFLQNLEKKRFIRRLSARSLSLRDLHAKSREHGS